MISVIPSKFESQRAGFEVRDSARFAQDDCHE